ncbi:Serine/threonine-protein kinase PrkC [Luteitalea pratensis]|uniref:Serine/threonine-protein kinase PrkC n=1 Tax=Luteitalea pratensis TaxID=1855912 RepID=A0A143PLV7_LUTPR|nr:protein kinase [Luteitalea pratensis]AMY09567.1 Serine/threonine-protein kinase PrkC [Luteitalea pratensis]
MRQAGLEARGRAPTMANGIRLAFGERVGSYEILSHLGSGGMGEVYRARDVRLGRTVALKVVAPHIAGSADADLRARFEREARAIAALDDPHICSVYDVGEHDGLLYLVMPCLEGQTLAARLATTRPLPLDDVLRIGQEVAGAMERTHRAHITHRDLKPANIMLTSTGAKLLDFGLAKALAPSTVDAGRAVTQLAPEPAVTTAGTLVGTLHYMAPEQVEGREADARSDIWAFGAVVYEMATGHRPFDGPSAAAIIGAILRDQPRPISLYQPLAPRLLDHVVARCLAKAPDERWQNMGDVRGELRWVAESRTDSPAEGSNPLPVRRRLLRWPNAAIAVAMVAATIAALAWFRVGAPPEPPLRASDSMALDLGSDFMTGAATIGATFILDPDGKRIVFVSTNRAGVQGLSTRRLDQLDATPLPGTAAAYAPFFSPDGEWVGFFADGKLKKLRIAGGEPVTLCDAPAGRGGSWGENGTIVAALDAPGRIVLSLVPIDGGRVTPATKLAPGERTHRWPHFLPGGTAALFTIFRTAGNFDSADIAVMDFERNVQKVVLPNAGMAPRYLRTGHLAYVSKGTLYVVPFDLERREVRGDAIPVLEGIAADPEFGAAQIDVSRGGTMVYRSGTTSGLRVLEWLDATGRTESMGLAPAFYQYPRVSPDGSRVAFELNEGTTSDIWVYDWQRGTRTKLTAGSGFKRNPVWSPDGQHVVFQSSGRLFWARADGASPSLPLWASQKPIQIPTSFTPDGKRLAFFEVSPDRGLLIQTAAVDVDAGRLRITEAVPYQQATSNNSSPAFSPDGRWMAYMSTDSGRHEVHMRAFPDTGRQWSISTAGGIFPVWSRTATELFYRAEDLRLMVVPYTATNDTFVAGRPRVWSDRRLHNLGLIGTFDLAPDGKRFAAVLSAEAPQPARQQVTLMLNFFDEVRRRVAASGR